MTDFLRHPAHQGLIDLAAGRRNVQTFRGRQKARGTITFAVNFVAGQTVTINGTVFTARASGASGNEFDIDSTLSLSLDALVTVLNASVVAGVAAATYAKSGTTILTITHDTAGDAGNAFTLAASIGTRSAATLAGGADDDTIDIENNSVVKFVTLDPGCAFTMPAGTEGQLITLFHESRTNSGNVVITGVFTGGTTLTFDAANDRAVLQYLNGTWHTVVLVGAAIT